MNNNTQAESSAVHPFYASMGEGPYSFVCCYDMGEAMNPNSAANFGNMAGWQKDAPKLKAGLGTCVCCGMGIMLICVVKNGAGELWGVGSDCIEKLDHEGAYKGAKAALALRTKRMNRARAAKKAAARFAAEAPERQRRLEEWNRAELQAFKARMMRAEQNQGLIREFFPALETILTRCPSEGGVFWNSENRWQNADAGYGRFSREVLASWMNGEAPQGMTDRGKAIICEIRAKVITGKSRGKAFEAEYERLRGLLEE